jgi:hypothetical protein
MKIRKVKRTPARTRESPKARKRAFEFVENTLKRSIQSITTTWWLVGMANGKDGSTRADEILPVIRAVLSEQITELEFALLHSYRAMGRERPRVQS